MLIRPGLSLSRRPSALALVRRAWLSSSSSSAHAPGVIPAIAADLPLFTEWRKDFHAHPELGFEEYRTSELVAERLRSFGVDEIETGLATTGVVATIRGRLDPAPGQRVRAVGLRADMDCLPMPEENEDLPHRSTADGRAHACGHDGHTTMLLAAAKHLCATRDEFAGSVRVIFQPAEEEGHGAREMIRAGLFDRFPCDEVFGIHNWPALPLGQVSVRSGPIMAAEDNFDITITGRGGHAAMPHEAVDPVVIGAQIVGALQGLVSRRADPQDAAVVSVTQFHAGSAYNVIPDTATLSGTLRSFREETRVLLREQVGRIAPMLAEGLGATAAVTVEIGYPATVNHAAQAARARAAAAAVVGEANIIDDADPTMGSEDFSYMLGAVPGCYIWLGQGPAAGSAAGPDAAATAANPALHNPAYDFNDDVLPRGASFFVAVVRDALAAPDSDEGVRTTS